MIGAVRWLALMLLAGTAYGQGLPSGLVPGQAALDARPSPPPSTATLAVLILSEAAGFPVSEIYAGVRQALEANTTLSVAPLDAIGITDREAAIRDCAGKAPCFAARVRTSAAYIGLLLTVSVEAQEDGFLLGLRLVDVHTGQEIGATADELPSGISMLGAMEQQLPDVFPGSIWGQIAALRVQTDPPNAEVSVGGRACVSPCTLTRMSPGTYEVTARLAGHQPWTGATTLVAREETRLNTRLEEVAGGVLSSPFFWGAVGLVAAVGAGVAVALALRQDDPVARLCLADDPSLCQL